MILCKWASRGRPRLFAANFPKWNQGNVRFLVSLDSDDKFLPAYRDFLYGRENVTVVEGTSEGKIHAINRDMERAGDWRIGVVCSDDMVPQQQDWADEVRRLMDKHWPDGDGVLHLNDGRNGRALNTLCIAGRKYFDRFGYWYHPAYRSLWADNEFQEVSEMLNRATYVDEVIVAHEWIGSTHPHDPVHLRNEQHYFEDAATFKRRKAAGFPA